MRFVEQFIATSLLSPKKTFYAYRRFFEKEKIQKPRGILDSLHSK